MPSISKMNKTELVEAIRTRGGAADMSTRRLELQQQLQQMLNEEAGVEVGGTSSARAETDYQRYTSEMNRASGRKKDLIEYMEKRLGIRAPENATVAQLTNLAMGKIYDLSVAHETDPVGFGKYGSLMVSGGRGESEIAPAGSVAEPDHGRQDYVFDGDIGTLMEERQGESRIPKDGDEERQDHRDHFVGSILKRSPEHDERDDGSDPSAALRSGRATEREAWQPTSPREPPGLRDELGSQLREGEWDEVSEATTPTAQEFAQRVVKGVLQELEFSEVLKEGQGETQLCEMFGVGDTCFCEDLKIPNLPEQKCTKCWQWGIHSEVKGSSEGPVEVHEDGTRLLGQARATRHKVTQFWPKEWHATCPWEGERITVTFYVSRGWGCAAEEPPTRRRIAGKRRPEAPQPTEDEDMEHEAPAPAQRRRQQAPHVEESGVCWWNDIREESWGNRGELWNSPDAAVEVHIDLPDSHRKLKQATANLASYFVGALKKRAVEVSEKRLDPQVPYVEDHLVEIPLCGSKRWNKDQPTSDREKTQLRVSKSTINTIIRTNMLVAHARARKQHIMKIHAFPPQEELCLYAWVDAGSQNRPDGGSTQGVFLGMSTMGLQRGEVQDVSPLSWSSHKIDRACRSPGAAETQAAVNGEDALFYLRYQWSEMAYGQVDVKDSESVVRRVPGCLISDSRNVFDKLNTEVLTIKGAEKRSNIELLAVKASQQQTGLTVRWVHSEAQLANSLTKAGATKELELYYQMGHQWRIVEDNEMKSARRRKQD
ncbi:unnamed protein product, partial [Symbiodinium microadriaticum]